LEIHFILSYQKFSLNHFEHFFFLFAPSQESCEGKVTQLYSGFGYEQIVKMACDLVTLASAAQILHSRTSCGKGTAKSSPKSLKKSPSPIHPKKTDFGW